MKITSAVERLKLHPASLRDRSLSRPIDPLVELATFLITATRLMSDTREVRPLDARELDELRRRCQSCDYNLSQFNKREIRILLRDEVTVLAPRFLANLTEAVRTSSLRIRVEPLITIYFNRWGSITDQQAFENLIRASLKAYRGCSPALVKYRGESTALFSPRADVFLAREALKNRDSVTSILKKWYIGATTALGHAAINTAVREYLPDFQIIERRALEPQALDGLEFLVTKLLSSEVVDPPLLHTGLAVVVSSQWSDKSEPYRQQVLKFVLHDSRLGNPRFPRNFPNWIPVDQKASQKVRSWLARQDIVFFFDLVLPERQDKHRRKEFWLQYVDQIQDSQVALCPEDRARLRAQVREQMAYTNIRDNGVSAFLMKFKGHPDIVVVEFSQSGNAVYFYDANIFQSTVGSFQQLSFWISELKHGDPLEKFTHYPPGQWQQRVRTFLAGRGVRLG